MSAGGGAETGEIASTQTHSFDEARDDGSALRFASGQTEGGSDQFDAGSAGSGQDTPRDRRQNETTIGGSGSGLLIAG